VGRATRARTSRLNGLFAVNWAPAPPTCCRVCCACRTGRAAPADRRSCPAVGLCPPAAPGQGDICPHTGRARLGYDRARILLRASTGWNLHQLRHSAATHLGDKEVPLQLMMAKTRHKSPRTAMRYVNPGPAAVAEATALLNPPKRTH